MNSGSKVFSGSIATADRPRDLAQYPSNRQGSSCNLSSMETTFAAAPGYPEILMGSGPDPVFTYTLDMKSDMCFMVSTPSSLSSGYKSSNGPPSSVAADALSMIPWTVAATDDRNMVAS